MWPADGTRAARTVCSSTSGMAPSCSSELRSQGFRTEQLRPGIGSKLWKKTAQEMDKLAMFTGKDGRECPYGCRRTGLCGAVRGATLLQELLGILARILYGFPLEQIEGLVSRLNTEIRDTKDGIAEVMTAFDGFANCAASEPPRPATGTDRPDEYSKFAEEVESFEWDKLIPPLHMTPNGPCFSLHSAWEAEWHECSSRISASAVEQRLWTFVPATLQATWLAAVQGHGPSFFDSAPIHHRFCTSRHCPSRANHRSALYTDCSLQCQQMPRELQITNC